MRLSGSNNFGAENNSPHAYSAHMGANRVRREPAVAGSSAANQRGSSAQSKSNSRTRAQEYAINMAAQKKSVRQRSGSNPTTIKPAPVGRQSSSSKLNNSGVGFKNSNATSLTKNTKQEERAKRINDVYSPTKASAKFAKKSTPVKDHITAMMGSGTFDKTSSLIGRQVEAEAASVDEKIEKLQNLLKIAKG